MEQLDEQHFVTDFVKKVFLSIVAQRNKAIEKAMRADPEFKRAAQKAIEARQELEAWVKKEKEKDPRFKDTYDFVDSLY